MSLFSRRPTRAELLEKTLDRAERVPELASEMLRSIETFLDRSIISSEYRDTKIPDELRARGEALVVRIKQHLTNQALATAPTARRWWPETKDRLRPCANCGSREYYLIEDTRIREFSAGGYFTSSPALDLAFCRGCGRMGAYARHLDKLRDYIATPTLVRAEDDSDAPDPYR